MFFVGPSSYKKDTIYAIEEEEDLNKSDADIESGRNKNLRKLKKKRRRKQDFRNKLEDWQNCLVSMIVLIF